MPEAEWKLGLLGWPLNYTVSPPMHRAALAALGLSGDYVALPTLPEDLPGVVRRMRAQGWRGVNVTIPHKRAVIDCVDELAPSARAAGAVNTLEFRGDRLVGHNTDIDGLAQALRAGGFPLGGRVLITGAGGASRAAARAALLAGSPAVVILARESAKAAELVSVFSPEEQARLSAGALTPESLAEAAHAADLWIQATPVGTWPATDASPWPTVLNFPKNLAVYDLVYNPLETTLVRQARSAGALAEGGLEMLARQGALSFEIWTGKAAPLDVMRRACRDALLEKTS